MTIGTHKVMVYSDRNAASWGVPIASNPYLTNNLDGWLLFGPGAGGWNNGGADMTSPKAFHRHPASGVNRPMAANLMRVRFVVTVELRGALANNGQPLTALPASWGINFGTTPQGGFDGQEWQEWTFGDIPPGNQTIETTFDVSDVPAQYVYVGPRLSMGRGAEQATGAFIHIDSCELQWRGGTSSDMSCLIDEVSIMHGRDGPTGQPEPSSATVDFTAGPGAPVPPEVEIGAVLVVSTSLPAEGESGAVESVRFTGRITDISLGWDEAGSQTPEAGAGQLTAIGMVGDLARRVVGDAPFPQELDGARVDRVLTLAGLPASDPRAVDPGTVQILPRDIDSADALDVIRGTAESANALLWATRAGEIRYHDSDHRRGVTTVALDLDACDIDVTPVWSRSLAGLVNRVSIGYGPEPEEGGEQARFVEQNDPSINKFGRFEYTTGSELADLTGATTLGRLLLARNSSPVWNLSTVPLDLADIDSVRTRRTLGLDIASLVRVGGLPALGTVPTQLVAWVEGWQERLAWGEHTLALVLSGYCRTAPPPRWDDVNPATTWDTAPAITWDDAQCLGPPADLGRWDDTSATVAWDDAPNPWDYYVLTPPPVMT